MVTELGAPGSPRARWPKLSDSLDVFADLSELKVFFVFVFFKRCPDVNVGSDKFTWTILICERSLTGGV